MALVEKAVDDAMTKRRERSRLEYAQEREQKEREKVTKTYLITFAARTGFPEPDGRVVMHETAYGRMSVYKDGIDKYSGLISDPVEIIAHGDGRLLKSPMKAGLLHAASMIEVSEEILAKRTETAGA